MKRIKAAKQRVSLAIAKKIHAKPGRTLFGVMRGSVISGSDIVSPLEAGKQGKPVREGWAEASQRIAALGDDKLV